MLDITFLRQILKADWFIDEVAAFQYGEMLLQILESKSEIKAGLFSDGSGAYRVDSSGKVAQDAPVLVLNVSGPLMKQDSCWDIGTATMTAIIEAANGDDSIEAIVLNMDTPGGSVDGTETFANAVKASRKPVVAFASLMCSAGYWIGSAANEIVIAGETAMVGSIGTMASFRNTDKADEASGRKTVHVFATRSTHKNRAALNAINGKPDDYIKKILDPLNAVFESTVTQNREGKIDLKKEDVLTGDVYIGSRAIEVGLADSIGTLGFAISRSLQLARNINS